MNAIRILPQVYDDLTEALNWYEQKGSEALANRFLDTFFSTLPQIAENPFRFAKSYSEFRRALLRPFPYKLHFRLNNGKVIVTLVIHCARDPRLAQRYLKVRS